MGDNSGRVHKAIVNVKVNMLFYVVAVFLAFFSRKIFLDCLGTEFMGLTGTLASILGYLNLAELGIVQCVNFFLYKPLQQGDRQKTTEIMSLMGYLYRCIGLAILVGGIAVSLFFPLIFGKTAISLGIVYFAFYSFLGSSLMGYFINYRQVLLVADQKNYLVAIYFQTATIAKTVAQIGVAYWLGDVYLWSALEVVFGLVGCVVLNWKINREYPWLMADKSKGRGLLKKYPEVLTYIRQIFIHKIKDFMLNRSDELFVFIFVSLKMVAYYGNYLLIITKVTSMLTQAASSVSASIGNLVAEGNRERTMQVFWEFTTTQHIVAGVFCFALYTLMEPLIAVWLGPEYVMDHTILVLLVIFVYISNSRRANDYFSHSYGLYADIWAAWVELGINVGVTIVCGWLWGITGILIGKIASLLPIVVVWKPYYLFKSGFRLPVADYWRGAIRNYGVFAVAFAVAVAIAKRLPIDPYVGYANLALYAAATVTIFVVLDVGGNIALAPGAKELVRRIRKVKSE